VDLPLRFPKSNKKKKSNHYIQKKMHPVHVLGAVFFLTATPQIVAWLFLTHATEVCGVAKFAMLLISGVAI
jgi:hypothetical protein